MSVILKKILTNYNLETVGDIIRSITPKGYNIAARTVDISQVKTYPDKTSITTTGYIDKFESEVIGRKGHLGKIKAKLFSKGESITLIWMVSIKASKKMQYSLKKSAKKDTLLQVSGKVDSFITGNGSRIVYLTNAKIEQIGGESKVSGGVVIPEPQYLLKKDTTYFDIKKVMRQIHSDLMAGKINRKDFLPLSLEQEFKLQDLAKTIKFMHGMKPLPIEKFDGFINYDGFLRRINAEKIWSILLSTSKVKQNIKPTIIYDDSAKAIVKSILDKLPFTLTKDQLDSIDGFLTMLSEGSETRSLIYGDVGSGKTLVALITAYVQYKQGFQVAIITPTTILSKQHYEEAIELFGKNAVAFITTKTKLSEKRRVNKLLDDGEPLIIIGGTGINNLSFKNLSSVYIDEEQKIGVTAKDALYNKFKLVNSVFMTATPIPRTLASAVFTNFTIFQIKAKPKNRKKRITKIFKFGARDKKELFDIDLRMTEDKQQTLIVVPSIDCEDMVNANQVREKYSKLFPSQEIRVIHGKMKKTDVDKEISDYMENKYPILIATVMIDSGFSNKNIAHVFIEGADRFGMSTLHQIRGRCGRGEKQGYCYLVPSVGANSDSTKKRLKAIVDSEDGFELSQKDIELRGSGDLDGVQQSGVELNFLEWIDEIPRMKDLIEHQNKLSDFAKRD